MMKTTLAVGVVARTSHRTADQRRMPPAITAGMLRLAGVIGLFAIALLGFTGHAAAQAVEAGAVFTSTNHPLGNRVVMLHRAADGALTPTGSVPTGGLGTGASLSSQGALALTENHRYLYVVNAGSNDISSFAVRPNGGLTLLGVVSSRGERPVSLTVAGDLLYVLNAGGDGNITGYSGARRGELTPIANGTRPLSGSATNPAQVQFTPDGRLLVVTERATNRVVTYVVDQDGRAGNPLPHASAGRTPFGFAIDNQGRVFVSEATDSSLSSYATSRDGALTTLSGAVGNGQMAACWAVVTENGRYVYTANAANGTITGYQIDSDGRVQLLNDGGRTATTGGNPTDMALSRGSRYLYALVNADQAVRAYRVDANGALTAVTGATGLMPGMAGLVAF